MDSPQKLKKIVNVVLMLFKIYYHFLFKLKLLEIMLMLYQKLKELDILVVLHIKLCHIIFITLFFKMNSL